MFFGNRNIMIVKKLRVCVDLESFFEGGGLREIYFVRVFKVYFLVSLLIEFSLNFLGEGRGFLCIFCLCVWMIYLL